MCFAAMRCGKSGLLLAALFFLLLCAPAVWADMSSLADVSHGAVKTSAARHTDKDTDSEYQFWTTGTVISDQDFSREDAGAMGGIGLTRFFQNGMSFGGGVFSGSRALDTEYGGSQDIKNLNMAFFLGYAPAAYGLRLESGMAWSQLDMDLSRGYHNGTVAVQSSGETTGDIIGFYVQAGWVLPVAQNVVVEPFARYDGQYLKIDGYTESDGPSPRTVGSVSESVDVSSLGVEAQFMHSPGTSFRLWASWSHRFQSATPAMSGQLLGFSAFNQAEDDIDHDWMNVGVGASWRPWERVETFTRLNCALDNQAYAAPDLSLTAGLRWDL